MAGESPPSVVQGGPALRLFASFETADGGRIEPIDPRVDIVDPDSVVVVNDAVVATDGAGWGTYDFAPALDAPPGLWEARFSATWAGEVLAGVEYFTVVASGLPAHAVDPALGPDVVAQVVRVRLASPEGVAAQLEALEAAHGPVALGPGPHPPTAPKLYAVSDRARLEATDWPAVLIVPQTAGPMVPVDIGAGGGSVYRVPYLVRVWCYVHGGDFDGTAAARNRLILAVRLALLYRLQLGPAHRLDPTTMRESYSDVGGKDRRFLAGAWVEVVVDATEEVSLPVVALVDTVGVSASAT